MTTNTLSLLEALIQSQELLIRIAENKEWGAIEDYIEANAAAIAAERRRIESAIPTGNKSVENEAEPKKLWLWRNFVNGNPEYWAFDNAYPTFLDNDDPQTLGEPCGYAVLKPSLVGRKNVSDEQVILDIKRAIASERSKEQAKPQYSTTYPHDGGVEIIYDDGDKPQADYPDPTQEMLNGDPLFDAIWGAIKWWDISRHKDGLYSMSSGNDARHIYDAIMQAKPQQEPAGYWCGKFKEGAATLYEVPQESCFGLVYINKPVYTSHQPLQPLSDEEIDELVMNHKNFKALARAIEAKLGVGK